LYPNTYVAKRLTYQPGTLPFYQRLDGDLNKDIWKAVPWSTYFRDIQGDDAPQDGHRPAPTRFKALWDDDYLYIGALLEVSPEFSTQAHFTKRNSPIYQKDSDFEVFVDVPGCHQDYKEFEMNAINTVWNLLLDKPYRDGGREHSGRIAQPGDADYYDVVNQHSAAKIVKGRLNDPTGQGATWSVEIAFSFTDLLSRYSPPVDRPQVGTMWRINFSRVELQGQVNWTWQPQRIWDASTQRHVGLVDMHLPDAWGYLVFGNVNDSSASEPKDRTWPARLTAMNVYYALHYYREQHNGSYTPSLQDLSVDPALVTPFDIHIDVNVPSFRNEDGTGFVVTVKGHDGVVVTVRDDRLLKVKVVG